MPTADSATFGIVVAVILALTLWLFEYRRDQREAKRDEDRKIEKIQAEKERLQQEKEPRANPPLHQQFASHDDVADLEADIRKLEVDFNARDAANAKTSHESREKIYNSIRSLEQSVSALKKENELFNQRLHQMDQKLDRLIERL